MEAETKKQRKDDAEARINDAQIHVLDLIQYAGPFTRRNQEHLDKAAAGLRGAMNAIKYYNPDDNPPVEVPAPPADPARGGPAALGPVPTGKDGQNAS